MIIYIYNHNPFGTKGGGAMVSHAFLCAFSEVVDGELDFECSKVLRRGKQEF